MVLDPAGEGQLEKNRLHNPDRKPRRASEFIDVHRGRAKRREDQAAVILFDERQRLGWGFEPVGGFAEACCAIIPVDPRRPTEWLQRLQDVLDAGDERGPLLDELVGSFGPRVERMTGHGKDLAPLIGCPAGGNE